MTLAQLSAAFVACVLLHNAEEALLLPAWSARAPRWYRRVGAGEFHFGVAVLSIVLVAAAVAAFAYGPRSIAAYIFFGYVFAVALNAVVPHLAASLALRRYMPGAATGMLLNLPLGAYLLRRAVEARWVETRQLLWVAPLVALGLLASIPLLFAIGRTLFPEIPGRANRGGG